MKTEKVMIFNKREGLFFHMINKWSEIGSCACQSRGLFNALVTGKEKASIVYQILIKKVKNYQQRGFNRKKVYFISF
jgi:hypothetical protein